MKKSFLALLLLLSLSVIPAAFAKEWDEGGLLDETDSITSWSITTDENALASSAAYLKCTTDPATLKSVTNSKLKEAATAVVACMAKVAETPGISLNEAHPYVLQCIAALKPNYPWVNTKTYASSAPVTSVSEQFIPSEDLSRAPTPEEEKESAAARVRIAKKTPPVQAEMKKLYKELLSMRGTKNFLELGFSGKNPKAVDWKKRVEAFRTRIEKDEDLPVSVRAAPAYLLTIGFSKQWRAGKDTADSKWDTQMILDGLNWKLEE